MSSLVPFWRVGFPGFRGPLRLQRSPFSRGSVVSRWSTAGTPRRRPVGLAAFHNSVSLLFYPAKPTRPNRPIVPLLTDALWALNGDSPNRYLLFLTLVLHLPTCTSSKVTNTDNLNARDRPARPLGRWACWATFSLRHPDSIGDHWMSLHDISDIIRCPGLSQDAFFPL